MLICTALSDFTFSSIYTGTTAQEVDLDPEPGETLLTWSADDLHMNVERRLDAFAVGLANRTLSQYLQDSSRKVDAELVYTSIATDMRVTCGNNRLALLASEAMTSPVYRYVTTACPSSRVRLRGSSFEPKYSFHGVDMFAFMDSIGEIPDSFTRLLRNNIKSFANTGAPQDADWLPYPLSVAILSEHLQVSAQYETFDCVTWKEEIEHFSNYSWTN